MQVFSKCLQSLSYESLLYDKSLRLPNSMKADPIAEHGEITAQH